MTTHFELQPDRRHPIFRDGEHVASFIVGVTPQQRDMVMATFFGREQVKPETRAQGHRREQQERGRNSGVGFTRSGRR